ncbi:UNVERIFIED_CONTAM: dockerin type I repeat protein [Acetivibrio alkalicellulosi]
MMKKKVSLLLVLAMILTLLVPQITANTEEPEEGYRRLQDFQIFKDDPIIVGWAGSGDEELETVNEALPVDFEETYNGLPSIRINVTKPVASWWWLSIIPYINQYPDALKYKGWSTYDFTDYVENGLLEFNIKGAVGGENFMIGSRYNFYHRGFEKKHDEIAVNINNYVNITPEWQSVKIPLKDIMTHRDIEHSPLDSICLVFKNSPRNTFTVWVNDIRIASPDNERSYPEIKVNQVGFLENSEKYALVSGFPEELTADKGTKFSVINVSDDSVVYEGTLSLVSEFEAVDSGEKILRADFSSVKTPGKYYISVDAEGIENSLEFKIGNGIYDSLLVDASRYFYYQRQGIELIEPYAPDYPRSDMTPNDAQAVFMSGEKEPIDITKGWHDAGDYGKYVNAGATAVSDLFWAYEMFPEQFMDNQFNIPESGNGIPDILDEARWELEWILKMQDKDSGGFYPRIQHDNFNIEDLETIDEIKEIKRIIFDQNGPTTDDTACAAAILAHAYIIYKDIDEDFANECLDAAKNAWVFLENNTVNIISPRGAYNVHDDSGNRLWASASLYRATNEEVYHNYFIDNYKSFYYKFRDELGYAHTWGDMWLTAFLMYYKAENKNSDAIEWINGELDLWITKMLNRYEENPWNNAIVPGNYSWGSNMKVLNVPMGAIIASMLMDTYNSKVTNFGIDSLNWILGTNPLRYSFVSGYGQDSLEEVFSTIYHYDDKVGIPKGYMAGGPNSNEGQLLSRFAAKCYSRSAGDWVSNEHSVYLNSSLVFMAAYANEKANEEPVEVDFKYGDLNNDGVINSTDYAKMIKHILRIERITDANIHKAGDLNGDGAINSIDLVLLRRYILEIIDIFPVEEVSEPTVPPILPPSLPKLTQSIEDLGDWSLYTLSNTKTSAESSSDGVSLSISKSGTSSRDIRLIYNDSIELISGEYELDMVFGALSNSDNDFRKVRVVLEKDDSTREVIYDNVFSISLLPMPGPVKLPFSVPVDCKAKFSIDLGYFDGEHIGEHRIEITNPTFKRTGDYVDISDPIDPIEPVVVNVPILNSDFSLGTADNWWDISAVEDGVGIVEVEGGAPNLWDVTAGYWRAFRLEEGREYTVSFDIATEESHTAAFEIIDDAINKGVYLKHFTLSGGGEFETIVFDDLELNEEIMAKFQFQLGFGTEGETYNVYIANVRITYLDDGTGAPVIDPKANLVRNADFSAGTRNWGAFSMSFGEADFAVVDEEAVVSITNTGTVDYAVQFFQDGIRLYEGNKYKLSFRYKANEERIGEVRIQENGGSYTGYFSDNRLTFTTEWQTYEKEFTMRYESDTVARLCFNLGKAGEATVVDQVIYFDDFSLVMTEGTIPEDEKESLIRLNQLGYRPDDAKVAFVIFDEPTFEVYTEDDKLVMTGNTYLYSTDRDGNPVVDFNSGDITRVADFSTIKHDGRYYIKAGDEKSVVFEINKNVYDEVTNAVLKLFYFQRSGELKEEYVGELFARGPGHTEKAKYYKPTDEIYGDVEIDVHGGWYDAGDYGRYITPASKAVADLLMTAEHFPSTTQIDFGGPDKLLGEIRYQLEWMLKMQHPETGGVYHKVTGQYHASMTTLPHNDLAQLYLSPVSAPATADFAAVMAYAYRMYKDIDEKFAKDCLDAALLAWKWLQDNPNINGYTDPDFFHSGDYNDPSSRDERFWAAAELYKTTEDIEFLQYMEANPLPRAGFGWHDMGSYALVALLTTDFIDQDSDLYKRAKNRFIADAQSILRVWENDGYKVALNYYVWGSNKDLADRAMILIFANKLEPDARYHEAVLDQVHYFLGRNANDISYVTDFGQKSAQNPHHRPSAILGQVVPGMLVGGPNAEIMTIIHDPVSQMVDEDTPPARRYADITGSYATNEICIYWNSPLAYVLGYIYELNQN